MQLKKKSYINFLNTFVERIQLIYMCNFILNLYQLNLKSKNKLNRDKTILYYHPGMTQVIDI